MHTCEVLRLRVSTCTAYAVSVFFSTKVFILISGCFYHLGHEYQQQERVYDVGAYERYLKISSHNASILQTNNARTSGRSFAWKCCARVSRSDSFVFL